MALGHEVAAVFAGGLAPFIATALLLTYNSSTPVALYAIGLAAITLIALAFSRNVGQHRTSPTDTQKHIDDIRVGRR